MPEKVAIFAFATENLEIMPKTFLTDNERTQILTLVRKFVKISPQTVSHFGFRRIRNYITEALKNQNVQRDVFGFSPIVTVQPLLAVCLLRFLKPMKQQTKILKRNSETIFQALLQD